MSSLVKCILLLAFTNTRIPFSCSSTAFRHTHTDKVRILALRGIIEKRNESKRKKEKSRSSV